MLLKIKNKYLVKKNDNQNFYMVTAFHEKYKNEIKKPKILQFNKDSIFLKIDTFEMNHSKIKYIKILFENKVYWIFEEYFEELC
jgi:hypothetical protein